MARSKPKSKEEFLAREQQVWDEMNSLVADLPARILKQPGAAGDWSVKDVWAHLAEWMKRTRQVVPRLIRGEKVKADIQAFNVARYETIRRMSVTESRDRLAQERKRFLAFIKRLPDEDLLGNSQVYSWTSFSCYNHYVEHIPGLKQFRDSIMPPSAKER